MITTFLQGGLGNQMFQISAAWALSKELSTDCGFDLSQTHILTQGNKASKYKDTLFRNLKDTRFDYNKLLTYREPSFNYSKLPLWDNILLIGSFQSSKYFEKFKDNLNEIFYLDNDKINETTNFIKTVSNNLPVCSIHVRRGDYLKSPSFHPTCTIEYYKKGMEIIGCEKYIVVSDDINWCKEIFVGDEFIFSPYTDELDDLYLIMNCNYHIIANSSFSWWGAYLCKNTEKKIVAPSIWFGPNGPKNTEDIYEKEWIKI